MGLLMFPELVKHIKIVLITEFLNLVMNSNMIIKESSQL